MKKYRSEKDCLNCGTTVEGNFCPNCGQENIQTKEPFWSFVMHGVAHYFHFDSKFLNSFRPLVTQPGLLTKEYIAGKRASHFPPLTMYLFISLVFFLLLSSHQPKIDRNSFNSSFDRFEHQMDSLNALKFKQTEQGKADSLTVLKKIAEIKLRQSKLEGTRKQFREQPGNMVFNIDGDSSRYVNVADYEHKQALLPPAKRNKGLVNVFFKKSLQLQEKYGQELIPTLIAEVQHQLPKMMFMLMPLFALILSISFYRSKMYFIEHLIYTLHVHSFLFLVYILIELVTAFWEAARDGLMAAAFFISIWYIYRSLRRVYGRGRWHTVFKFLILGSVYFVLLAICFLFIVGFSVVSL